jgi:integrase
MTAKEIESLARQDGRHSTGDGTGLALLVRDGGGRRMWVQRVTMAGKVRELGHGTYPGVSLAKARAAANKVHDDVKAGLDPLAARHAKQAAAKAAVVQTLDAALSGHIEAHAGAWKSEKTRVQTRTSLEQHAKALLSRPVRDITTEDVRAVLAPIWSEKPVLAQKVRSRLEAAIEWAIAAKWRAGPNPAAWRGGLRPLLAKPSAVTRNRHHPALPWEQAPAFLAELRDENGTASRCLEFVILTAVRSGEARGATWAEVDLDAALWTVPAARMKGKRPHRVPLSAPAVVLLRGLRPKKGDPDPAALVFPTGVGTALSDMALLAVIKRMDAARRKAEGAGWCDEHGARITPHGFRSTFRSWCGDHGQPREIAEAALAHVMGSETERAYARSDLLARRARLMAMWAAHCEGRAAAGQDAAAAAPTAGRVVAAA